MYGISIIQRILIDIAINQFLDYSCHGENVSSNDLNQFMDDTSVVN